MRIFFLVLLMACGSAITRDGALPLGDLGESVSGTNRLFGASSPYLAMHGEDPVDWFPWGDEAFAEAKRRNVPVFLSIGYFACHWCHVMHHESFKDETVAAYLNANFVAIKVDREERPDIDAVYMDAVQILNSGNTGWPASIWLTPDREPFYAGTYFPPVGRGRRPGFREVLEQITGDWLSGAPDIQSFSARIRKRLQSQAANRKRGSVPDQVEKLAAEDLYERWERSLRGWSANKQFPMTARPAFLLHYGVNSGDVQALHIVEDQLKAMDEGGIHDHLGGGFHRYTVDPFWRVPHFEKMLYDNGQLIGLYAEAAVVLESDRFAQVARDIGQWLIGEMQRPQGAFYSSQSADSEGEEGTFYVWKPAEIRAVLGEGADFIRAYGVSEKGNFEGNRTVLIRRSGDPESVGLKADRKALYLARAEREHPPTDDKAVVAWNGLAISGLARAGRLLGVPEFVEAAKKAATDVLGYRSAEGNLPRVLADNPPPGVLSDYAFMAEGLLDLYEADGDPGWLLAADGLAKRMLELFQDPETGALYQTGANVGLIARKSEPTDGSEPSGPGRALWVLQRLAALGAPSADRAAIERGLENNGWLFERAPGVVSSLAEAAGSVGMSFVVAVDSEAEAAPYRALFGEKLRPGVILAVVKPEQLGALTEFTGLLGKLPGAEGPLAYVCTDGVCKQPSGDLGLLRRLLESP
jgi:uncharacterized protein YyaL (SSP411 family)